MRRSYLIPLAVLAFAAAPALKAQEPHLGFSIDLGFPTGEFNSKTYPPNTQVLTPQTESYDVGLGATFDASFPTSRVTAIRLRAGFMSNSGRNTAPGYDTQNLRHDMVSLGGDLQIFPGQGAFRHRGFYLLGGLSADFESYNYSYGDPGWDYTSTTHKSRLGGEVGIGHSFGYDSGTRFTLEATYHTSLSSHDVEAGDPPATSYVRLGVGWVF